MRLIDADAIIDFIDIGHLRNPLEACFSERDIVDMLEARPTVDAIPVTKGRWILNGLCWYDEDELMYKLRGKPYSESENKDAKYENV